ncbi:hypothetical protein ACFWIY_19060 [Streptomyces sioyaensis]
MLIVISSWFAPEEKVGAIAQLIGATTTAAMMLREPKTQSVPRTLV